MRHGVRVDVRMVPLEIVCVVCSVDEPGLKAADVHLPLPPRCRDKGVSHHAWPGVLILLVLLKRGLLCNKLLPACDTDSRGLGSKVISLQ